MSALLQVKGVSRRFVTEPGVIEKLAGWLGANTATKTVHAVDEVSFDVARGEVVGLVGESGCGKSTLGRMIAGLLAPSGGELLYDGRPLPMGTDLASRRARLRLQMIFQDPMSSLNPRMKVGDIIGEAAVLHGMTTAAERDDYVGTLLEKVALDRSYGERYAHQFSGGQRQRICIARALAVRPDFLICDESVAALDVSIQAQIINLFQQLRKDLGLTYLFISHDLGVIQHLADRVVVMYLGRVVETGPAQALFAKPLHPYTQALLEQVPKLHAGKRAFIPIKGEIASPLNPPAGCHFHTRCPQAGPRCQKERPAIQLMEEQTVACHLHFGGTR